MTDSDAVVYVDDKGVLKTKPMEKMTSNAKFTLRSVDWAGRPSSIERFDCPPERIKEIRRRYAKVANNKKLRTEVVSTDEEFHGGFEEIHRFYKGHLAEVTTTSFHGSMGGSNFKYFWQSDKVYYYSPSFGGMERFRRPVTTHRGTEVDAAVLPPSITEARRVCFSFSTLARVPR